MKDTSEQLQQSISKINYRLVTSDEDAARTRDSTRTVQIVQIKG